MGTLKVEGDDELIERFKMKARKKYGQKRGSIKKATMDLIEKWLAEEEVDWSKVQGRAESEKTSVELQEEAFEKVD